MESRTGTEEKQDSNFALDSNFPLEEPAAPPHPAYFARPTPPSLAAQGIPCRRRTFARPTQRYTGTIQNHKKAFIKTNWTFGIPDDITKYPKEARVILENKGQNNIFVITKHMKRRFTLAAMRRLTLRFKGRISFGIEITERGVQAVDIEFIRNWSDNDPLTHEASNNGGYTNSADSDGLRSLSDEQLDDTSDDAMDEQPDQTNRNGSPDKPPVQQQALPNTVHHNGPYNLQAPFQQSVCSDAHSGTRVEPPTDNTNLRQAINAFIQYAQYLPSFMGQQNQQQSPPQQQIMVSPSTTDQSDLEIGIDVQEITPATSTNPRPANADSQTPTGLTNDTDNDYLHQW